MAALVIKGMVKKTDPPFGLRALQVLVKPAQLSGIHVVAVEREESHVSLAEGVVTLAAHVERLVKPFVIGIIVISQRGVELHASVEKRLVRLLELIDEVTRGVAAVDVVAKHDHEVELDSLPVRLHQSCDIVLLALASAAI